MKPEKEPTNPTHETPATKPETTAKTPVEGILPESFPESRMKTGEGVIERMAESRIGDLKSQTRDADGEAFDPEKHWTDKDGNGRINKKDGRWRKPNGRKKGISPKSKKDARPKIPGTTEPDPQIEAQQRLADQQSATEAAYALCTMVTKMCEGVLDFEPEPEQGVKAMSVPLGLHFAEKGITEMKPLHVFGMVATAYVLRNVQREKPKARLVRLRFGIWNAFQRFRKGKRKPEEETVPNVEEKPAA